MIYNYSSSINHYFNKLYLYKEDPNTLIEK